MNAFRHLKKLTAATLWLSVGTAFADSPSFGKPIEHIIVVYMENCSFDALYGNFPGAEGRDKAGAAAVQLGKDGKPYAALPQPLKNKKPDDRFPTNLANAPFSVNPFIKLEEKTGDMVHKYYTEQRQINGGKMDRFVSEGDSGGLVMGWYDNSSLKLWQIAKTYTLCDHFFHSAFGGSFLNHFWLVSARTPRFENAPAEMLGKTNEKGQVIGDPVLRPDGYAVNTIQSVHSPHAAGSDEKKLLPAQDYPTIGDRLSEKKISWAWFSGGWDDALAGKPGKLFQFHHQSLAYFKNYADGTEGRKEHLKDEKDFFNELASGKLRQVSFVKPIGENNQHPGYASIAEGDAWAAALIGKVQNSPYWKKTAIILTYDENGGMWDHVAPPVIDEWGPGTRTAAIVISPYAKKNFVDKTVLETSSILAFIEKRFGLKPLTDRDAKANDFSSAFDWNAKP